MDISLDLILASVTPIKLIKSVWLNNFKPARYDNLATVCARKKVANITVSRDIGHAETAPGGNFFSPILNAIKL